MTRGHWEATADCERAIEERNRGSGSNHECAPTPDSTRIETTQGTGTRMINNGVPQHIIQRYLGHESPNMTAVYAHIHDQTLKEEIAKFHGKVVNIAGESEGNKSIGWQRNTDGIKASDKSKDTLIIEIKKQNKELKAKIQQLNKEIEILLIRNLGIDGL